MLTSNAIHITFILILSLKVICLLKLILDQNLSNAIRKTFITLLSSEGNVIFTILIGSNSIVIHFKYNDEFKR